MDLGYLQRNKYRLQPDSQRKSSENENMGSCSWKSSENESAKMSERENSISA